MGNPLDARLIARKMRRVSKPAVLIKVTAGTRTAGSPAGGTNPTEASYAARGWVTTTRKEKIGGTLVEQNDRVVALLGATIASAQVPTTKDKLTILSKTQRIVGVDVDLANAVYVCLCRS